MGHLIARNPSIRTAVCGFLRDEPLSELSAARLDRVVHAGAGVETRVQGSLGIRAGDAVAAGSRVLSEDSAHQNSASGLQITDDAQPAYRTLALVEDCLVFCKVMLNC